MQVGLVASSVNYAHPSHLNQIHPSKQSQVDSLVLVETNSVALILQVGEYLTSDPQTQDLESER